MENSKQTPNIVTIGFWLLSLGVFVVGFWHTHLGLKEMRPFNSEYGSLIIAAIVLLTLLLTYWYAVNGKTFALIFYIMCGSFFFLFNLNYFYPAYMARQLVKEEAISLNDTIHTFADKSKSFFPSETTAELVKVEDLTKRLLSEIKNEEGFGPRATGILNELNSILGSNILPSLSLGRDQAERDKKALVIQNVINDAAETYFTKKLLDPTNKKKIDARLIRQGQKKLDSIVKFYEAPLKKIIEDDHEIKLDSLIVLRQKGENHFQIKTLQNLVTDLDNATKNINEGYKAAIFPTLEEAETRNLGRIAHTLKSVGKRIKKTDTLIIIFLCLFIDLIVPLAVYLLLRKKGDEPPKKLFTNPINFNKK